MRLEVLRRRAYLILFKTQILKYLLPSSKAAIFGLAASFKF
ncbi:hypothetical protein CAMSH0001_0022 [Campylobacter showae RM3277]|uniref:Uncharacterized protein n=1 Tax=Campylobacter showae RM3277 TaxID=553219 RepID=C6RDJ1_9BACT|nr:hypothetical protein CAMSH0001_0022 [Campylobacter showae RM3277]